MTSQNSQVVIRPTSDENVREYHLGVKITEQPYAEFFAPMYGSEADFDSLGKEGKKIATQLMNRNNNKTISRITFRPFSVRVYKAPAADWVTVEGNLVFPALKAATGQDVQAVQYGSSKQRELALA